MNPASTSPAGEQEMKGRSGPLKWILAGAVALACFAAAVYFYFRFQVLPLPAALPALPSAEVRPGGDVIVLYPGAVFVARVATFRDELFAYLMYQHFRSSNAFNNDELLLGYATYNKETPEYQVLIVLTDDFAAAVERVSQLHSSRRIEAFDWSLVSRGRLTGLRNQTRLFISA